MNAVFGLILKSSIRKKCLMKIPRELRSWGGDIFEVGDEKFNYPKLEGVEFKVYPVTDFIRKNLPLDLQEEETEHASIEGSCVDNYEDWLRENRASPGVNHPFELGIKALIEEVGLCSLLLVPDSDCLEQFVSIRSYQVIRLLREHITDLPRSPGFMASIIE